MTIRDRGRIKWTSLMLPEHVKTLRNLWNDEYERVPKPILDEMELEEIDKKISYSLEFSYKVKMRVWEEGYIFEYGLFT